MKCKPDCAPGGTLSKTRLASCSGGILAGYWRDTLANTGEPLRLDTGRILGRDTQGDTRRHLLASYSGILSWMLGGIRWQALVGYSAGSTGELLWWDTRWDPLASYSGILSGILGGIHWRAALVGYSAGSTGELLWRDTWRDPASYSGLLSGIHWRAALVG